MKHKLYPDYDFKSVGDITDEVFDKYRFIIFDLDNTIAPYEQHEPSEQNLRLFEMLNSKGITFAFISNNGESRLKRFCEGHGWHYVHKARKPSARGVKRCLDRWGASAEQALMIGDQLLTDCAAAHRAGVDFCLVEPIRDRKNLLFRIKRAIEKPILKKYRKEG